jgi:hypothetical protein
MQLAYTLCASIRTRAPSTKPPGPIREHVASKHPP